jgi:integrase/recombinase XerC
VTARGRKPPSAKPPAPAAGPAQQLLQGYIDHLAHERRLAAHTTKNYRRDIEALLEFAADRPPTALTAHDIRRCIAQLHGKGLDGRSLARMLSAWRGFYNYLARDHGGKQNPCLGIRAPKSAKRLPHALSPDEARQLVELDADDALALRDKAMLELFYSSGLRLAELTGLAPEDVNFSDATVRVTGKGGKTRIVPVGSHAATALKAWLSQRAAIMGIDEQALFVNQQGRRLGPRAIQDRVKRRAQQQGIASRVHPHMLRHSFASHVLQSSSDLRAVQEMLGHASISTTQVYTQLDYQHLAKIYDAAHPRARRKNK